MSCLTSWPSATCFHGDATVGKVAVIPYSSPTGAHKYLQKYGRWFESLDRTELYFVLYNPPNHWAACQINFKSRRVRYGDSLGWERPKLFFECLPCAPQTDGFSCLIIAVNTIAHNALGDPVWTQKRARAMRMKAFCDIVEHYANRQRSLSLL